MLLRLGDRGLKVKELQDRLKITSDGIFGKGTERAVKEFQYRSGLVVDGIVGPVTWSKLKKVSKRRYKKETITRNGLRINNNFLPRNEYMTGSNPIYIFLHHTAGWFNPYKTVRDWDNDNRGKIATEFVIGGQSIKGDNFDYDGEVVKCLPDGGWGWHLGIGNNRVHRDSIGIELNNFGYLTKGGYNKGRRWIRKDNNKFYTYVGTEAHPSQVCVLDKPFRGHKYWHKYSSKQIHSLRELLIHLARRNRIRIDKGITELFKIEGYSAFEYKYNLRSGRVKGGVWSHTNVRKDKFDIYPHPELVRMLTSFDRN